MSCVTCCVFCREPHRHVFFVVLCHRGDRSWSEAHSKVSSCVCGSGTLMFNCQFHHSLGAEAALIHRVDALVVSLFFLRCVPGSTMCTLACSLLQFHSCRLSFRHPLPVTDQSLSTPSRPSESPWLCVCGNCGSADTNSDACCLATLKDSPKAFLHWLQTPARDSSCHLPPPPPFLPKW